MTVSFLSPKAALIGLAVILPLAAFVLLELRAARVRRELRLRDRGLLPRLGVVLAIAAFAALVAAASAQPVVERTTTRFARNDAAAFFVIDTSRSMLASEGRGKLERFERARAAALRLRLAIPDVRVGLASITDRVLPHVFPTADVDSFVATLNRSIAVNRPPPSSASTIRSTDYGALSALANQNFFPRRLRHRLVIVLTDGESIPVTATYLRNLYNIASHIHVIFVRFWSETERIYGANGQPDAQYRPDPGSGTQLARIASTMGGKLVGEHDLGEAIASERGYLGTGKRIRVTTDRRPVALAPYGVLAAFLPLGFLLWRRNL